MNLASTLSLPYPSLPMPAFRTLFVVASLVLILGAATDFASAQVLDKQRQLERQTFWDNRDFSWFAAHVPMFECPDAELETTYYYRWELLTKHLVYGSPNTGYTFTEFIDRPFWSGAYGAISCPAGHQLYEARWLRQPRIARDFARYWHRTPGAQPRNYSSWLADATWALHEVHHDEAFVRDLLPDLVANYEGWERRHFVPDVGMFWQTGHDDGMEFNINSRQTQDILRGAPGYRPSFNAYLWADARAIARIARLQGDATLATRFDAKADALKKKLQDELWDARREFFFPMFKNDEMRDGHLIKARTLTYQSGQFAGNEHGRELIGYVPWQFNLPDSDKSYERAWKFLMDREYFQAEYGPTTVERRDPMFLLQKSCCWWSGQSWPYATSQTLKAMANLLQNYRQSVVSPDDYVRLLRTFALTHRKDDKPYLAEACHPDTGSFEGHDGYNHSEHYFHSSFCDLVITGLVGMRPRADDRIEIHPLAPAAWDYFALDDLPYHGHRLSVVWDKQGTRYAFGPGLHVIVDGKKVASAAKLEPLATTLPSTGSDPAGSTKTLVNFAVNNDGDYYPRTTASHVGPRSSVAKIVDGNYWYHQHPPNRWTTEGSTGDTDWLVVELGVERPVHTIKLYVLDDERTIRAPRAIRLEAWRDGQWRPLGGAPESSTPVGHRPYVWRCTEPTLSKLRATFEHAADAKSGLTELELWGDAELPVAPAPPPAGNLAFNPGKQPFPKVTASHTSRFDKVEMATDGRISFGPTPHNRWTSYESPNATDWLEVDFGQTKSVRRVELAIYDDRGGVQAPTRYAVEAWNGEKWTPVEQPVKSPERPVGGALNEVSFAPVQTTKLRVVFEHAGRARSGVSELMIWEN